VSDEQFPDDPWESDVVVGLRESEAVFAGLVEATLDDCIRGIDQMVENDLRTVLFTLALRERFRRQLDSKREEVEAELWRSALRSRHEHGGQP
jgi:hypothetical protein